MRLDIVLKGEVLVAMRLVLDGRTVILPLIVLQVLISAMIPPVILVFRLIAAIITIPLMMLIVTVHLFL